MIAVARNEGGMSEIVFSCIIPASPKDVSSQKLQDLIASIRAQDFPQEQIEVLVITEGDSESAKAIGIREAQGEICAMFCADNFVTGNNLFTAVHNILGSTDVDGVYTKFFPWVKNDNSLNRYFSLIGNNDPIAFYLNKADRCPHYNVEESVLFDCVRFKKSVPSLGDNGFFYKTKIIRMANLEHYYPMDCAEDLREKGHSEFMRINFPHVWHRTAENLISFLIKRYKYARDLYSDRNDRRWKMLDTREDYWRLLGFIVSTLTIVPLLCISIRGFLKVRDWAWFWHVPVCIGFLITYGILTLRNACTVLSSFRRLGDLKRFGTVLSPCGHRPTKTSK